MGLGSLALVGALLFPRVAAAQNQTQVTVSGVAYAQYGYLLKDTANHNNNFDITRAYINLIGKFAGGVGGLRLTGYGPYGKPTGGGKRQRIVGMVSYRSKQITLAGEYAITKDSVAAAALLDGNVVSGFGVFHFPNSKAAVIARVDFTKPNKNGVS